MTRFLKKLEARMNDPEFNKRFSQAVQTNRKPGEFSDAYKQAKKNFYSAQEK